MFQVVLMIVCDEMAFRVRCAYWCSEPSLQRSSTVQHGWVIMPKTPQPHHELDFLFCVPTNLFVLLVCAQPLIRLHNPTGILIHHVRRFASDNH